ncbi:hypothetical protein, partial [Salmonella sp. SAL4357]|uniref:hypothetical protein n=1 Tax=Salmonella sp. SAL4357 TaxID=3159878 RepID=UPI003978E8D4
MPIPQLTVPRVLIVGMASSAEPEPHQIADLRELAKEIGTLINRRETAVEELARLRRLEMVESVMPALIPVLDVRQIFTHLSE